MKEQLTFSLFPGANGTMFIRQQSKSFDADGEATVKTGFFECSPDLTVANKLLAKYVSGEKPAKAWGRADRRQVGVYALVEPTTIPAEVSEEAVASAEIKQNA